MENFKKVFDEILITSLGITAEQIVPDARFKDDLRVDSLEMIELIMEFEKKFDIDISDEEAEEIKTVFQAEKYLTERLNIVAAQSHPTI